ncbi:MAG TPA: hypothetical protein VJR89_41495 [Polyangiales bacterium]|nr:hypothetical protein [Polyangiales bacterium]
MDWRPAHEVLAKTKVPEGYRLEQMTREDVPIAASRIRQWYPDIVVGMESPHLSEAFWLEHTLLAGETEDRALFPIVARHAQDGVVAVITYEKNSLARSITSRLGVLAAEHRHTGLGLLGPILLEELGRAIGAELAYYFATLKTKHQQVIAERRGFRLVGIVPGYDRDMINPGETKRVYEALYAKLLVGPEQVFTPPASALTPATQAVWRALFESTP